jgi:hypothetical protein
MVGYLLGERGVTALTVEAYVFDVRRFRADWGGSDVRGLTAADVSCAVLGQVGERAPARVRRFGCGLRSFLRYCYVVGLVDQDLSGAARPVSVRRRSLPGHHCQRERVVAGCLCSPPGCGSA